MMRFPLRRSCSVWLSVAVLLLLETTVAQGTRGDDRAPMPISRSAGRAHSPRQVASASCFDHPDIAPNPPLAGFDTYVGTGTGTYNGVEWATIEWRFTDAGEPGNNDTATIVVREANGVAVLTVSGTLSGDHQAHTN
ncbi:MAG: hypothetical protein HYX77_09375 [Acidobacteria bacterium]|nr:hypothetical protein [Acidobacteriota bacterium]